MPFPGLFTWPSPHGSHLSLSVTEYFPAHPSPHTKSCPHVLDSPVALSRLHSSDFSWFLKVYLCDGRLIKSNPFPTPASQHQEDRDDYFWCLAHWRLSAKRCVDWINKWMEGRIEGWMNYRVSELMDEWMSPVNEWTVKWVSKWMSMQKLVFPQVAWEWMRDMPLFDGQGVGGLVSTGPNLVHNQCFWNLYL